MKTEDNLKQFGVFHLYRYNREFETAGYTEIDIFISLLCYVVIYIATRIRGFNQLGQIISWVISETGGSSLIPASPAISDAQEFVSPNHKLSNHGYYQQKKPFLSSPKDTIYHIRVDKKNS